MLLNRLPLNMLPPRAVLLAADVVLLSLPEGEDAQARFFSGREPPYGTVAVRSASELYQIAAMRLSDRRAGEADAVDPMSPVVLGSDIAELAEELDTQSQRRLLGFLLGIQLIVEGAALTYLAWRIRES